MSREIVEGKRTLIEGNGVEFELPDRHGLELIEPMDDSLGKQWVTLNTPGEGSLFSVDLEEGEDAVVVHLQRELGRHGRATWGNERDRVRGYPSLRLEQPRRSNCGAYSPRIAPFGTRRDGRYAAEASLAADNTKGR